MGAEEASSRCNFLGSAPLMSDEDYRGVPPPSHPQRSLLEGLITLRRTERFLPSWHVPVLPPLASVFGISLPRPYWMWVSRVKVMDG